MLAGVAFDSCQCWQVSLLAGGKVLGGGQWFVVGRGGGGIEGGWPTPAASDTRSKIRVWL
jgi:hypothetical protein